MPGGHGIGHQSVDGSHPLYLRWAGSAPPYAVSILRLPADTGTPEISVTTSELHTELDLSHLPAGEYSLSVKGRNRLALTLPFAIVEHADVPAFKSGATDVAAGPEHRIEQAIFLLRRPDTSWRVEAISQLLALSAEGNFFAKAIVGVENTVKKPSGSRTVPLSAMRGWRKALPLKTHRRSQVGEKGHRCECQFPSPWGKLLAVNWCIGGRFDRYQSTGTAVPASPSGRWGGAADGSSHWPGRKRSTGAGFRF